MTNPGGSGNSGPWWVIVLPPGPHGVPGHATVSQKPFPPGSHILSGPYKTKAEALASANTWFPKGAAGSGVAHAIGNVVSPIGAIGDFFHRLTEEQTWIRVGEIIGGGILLLVGLRALTRGSPVVGSGARKTVTTPVKKTAVKVAKVAVPEARYATRIAAKKVAPKTTGRVTAHREKVAVHGQKKPYRPPPPRPARQPTVRVSHIYHHAQKKPVSLKKKPVKKP